MDIAEIYDGASFPSPAYYTELEGLADQSSTPGSFTGYVATRTSSFFSSAHDDFHRLHGGNKQNIILGGTGGGAIGTQDR
jgi:hypothetical protein